MTDQDGQEPGQSWAPLAEVAAAYGVSIDTIRRRMKRGDLEARRQQTPQGFKWLARMPDMIESAPPEPSLDASDSSQPSDTMTLGVQVIEREELVATLRQELALRNREIARLHEVIVSQAKAIEVATAALPANAQGVDRPPPALATKMGASDTLDDAIEQSGTFWPRVRKWFAG